MLYHQARVTAETKLVFNVAVLFPSQVSSSQPLTVPIIRSGALGRLTWQTPCYPPWKRLRLKRY